MRIILIIIFIFSNSISYAVEYDEKAMEIVRKYEKAGLVELSEIDTSIVVKLVNSNKRYNYFKKNFYGNLDKCYLQKEVAVKLRKAQEELKKIDENYSLVIMDGARPRSVSWEMYNSLKNTPMKRYVANPEKGSMHNYGAAVDLTIVDENGNFLDMGYNPFYKNRFSLVLMLVKYKFSGALTEKQVSNRELLKKIMEKAGFQSIKLEWWHFNGFSKADIRKKYKIIE